MIAHRLKVDEVNGPRSLLAIEFNKGTLMEPQSGKYPTATISALNASKPDALQKIFRTIIQTILKKMKEKSSLNHELVKMLCVFHLLIFRRRRRHPSQSSANWSQ